VISYQLKLVVAENKLDEFVDSLRYLSSGIRKEQGCLDFSLCRDFQKKNAYRVLGEWKTRQAMEGHFKQEKFSVLIGAARVLGEDFEMSIGETLEKGCYQFAQEKISPQPGKGKLLNTKSITDLKLEVVNGE
jgi:quinol monooxygenase YgiN